MPAFQNARRILTGATKFSSTELEKAEKLNNINSWNMGCVLLTNQDFSEGWKLFEYGMRTQAIGPQKWQRAMPKPFTSEQCPLWRGESLSGKTLFLLEEQAIGDVMQFLTLLPQLLNEAGKIFILIGARLVPVYKRSFADYISSGRLQICTFDDINKHRLSPDMFDFQSPLGSICRYRFTDISIYGQNLPILKVDEKLSLGLKNKYLQAFPQAKKVVGVSWRGGGRADRIKQKSVSTDAFGKLLLSTNDTVFVSLQYGESSSIVSQWKDQGIPVIHDNTIDPLKDIDSWHAQVAACDGVLSIANTTIHGAGGLNIPTYCLLSQDSDWRWLKGDSILRSYWYPSVGIARQSASRDWEPAFKIVKSWLQGGTPMPEGPSFFS